LREIVRGGTHFSQLAGAVTEVRPNRGRNRSIVPVKYLDPTLDIVFKLLLLSTPELLRDMIEAVLDLATPIESVQVLNPEIPRDFPGDKGIALDLRLRLQNGHQIDLEMQSTVPDGIHARFVYYWAKAFAGSLKTGGDYRSLRPTISILWLKKPLLKIPGFHSVFHLAEDHTQEIFSEGIELHVLELPHLGLASTNRRAKLERWARFLAAQTPEELEALASEDPMMNTARSALETLSSDPEAQRLAEERETSLLMHEHYVASAFEAGEAKGEAKGLKEGRQEAVRSMCELLGVEIDEARERQLATLELDQLSLLVQKLKDQQRWPEDWQTW
jgi:predicted transposase/invertase (TIGR01784 family)